MNLKNVKLWQRMAEMTFERCKKKCHLLGSCCSENYCNVAKDFAERQGIELKETGNKIPFLDNTNKCIVPPQLRPLCTIQQCCISSLGFAKDDPKWTEEYFRLRERLERTII
jgi:hypothetical protein